MQFQVSTAMDYTTWVEMQQNPNPNSHNLISDPYQSSTIDSYNALFLPLPQPPGVDPPYVPPPPSYVPPPATVNYAQQPIGFESQRSADAAAAAGASYYPDPNVSWTAAVSQFEASHCAAVLQLEATHFAAGVVSTPNSITQPQRRHTCKKGPKKTKIVQSAWCEVCNIDCNSKGVLDQHKLGKKHLKNLEKLKGATIPPAPAVTAATTAVVIVNPPAANLAASPATLAASTSLAVSALAVAPTDKPIIGPEENPEKSKSSSAKKNRKKAAACTEDLETKRRRVLEGGAAADAVRSCSICNVVCNSDMVFSAHLAGQKHASMIRKHALKTGVAFAM